MSDYGQSITLARLYERTSAKGNTYLAGRLGLVSVVAFKTTEVSDSGQPLWVLKVSETQSKAQQEAPRRASPVEPRASDARAAARDFPRPVEFDDQIPF
jgi:hypothetical protein